MRKLALAFLFFPVVALADEYERFLLPVTPSTVFCGYNSRYETRLLMFNDSDARVAPVCFGADCDPLEARSGRIVEGPPVLVPLPSFIYFPKGTARGVSAKLEVESSHGGGTDRFFTEIPIVAESDLRERIELLGVRVDGDYRQTLRIFGREEDAGTTVHMYIYDIRTGQLAHEHRHTMYVYPVDANAALSSSPSFSMECNLHELDHALEGSQFRIVLVPEERPAKIWAFISVTNNETQHFYNVLPE
jgi:hypothetical protein